MSIFDMRRFKKSNFDGFKSSTLYLQLNIKGCCMLCLMEKQPINHLIGEMSYKALSKNLNKISKIVIFGQKWCFCKKKINQFLFICFCLKSLLSVSRIRM